MWDLIKGTLVQSRKTEHLIFCVYLHKKAKRNPLTTTYVLPTPPPSKNKQKQNTPLWRLVYQAQANSQGNTKRICCIKNAIWNMRLYRKSYERECILGFMNTSNVLKLLKIALAFMRFFIYYILNNITPSLFLFELFVFTLFRFWVCSSFSCPCLPNIQPGM